MLEWSRSGTPRSGVPLRKHMQSQALAGTSKRSAHSIRRAYTRGEVPEELLPLLVSPEWVEARKGRCDVTSPIYLSKVLGEFFLMSPTDTLIQPKWIESGRPRTRRPLIAAHIARFGEDETVIMRREGEWIRVYRATTSRHDDDGRTHRQAMPDIDQEDGGTTGCERSSTFRE
jgi:hypothetical protein